MECMGETGTGYRGMEQEGERMIDFLLTCAAVDAFLMVIVSIVGIVVTLLLVVKMWEELNNK